MARESKAKRTPSQALGLIFIFVLAVLIILTFVIFGIFKESGSAPKLFGYRVYVVGSDRMEPRIPKGAAVFVEEGALPDANAQSVILCEIDNRLWVIGFVGTTTTESGETSYLVKYDNATDDKIWGITQDDIVGVAKKYDTFVGGVIRFASSKAGMLTIVIVPCALLLIYEIVMLLLSARKDGGEKAARNADDEKELAEDFGTYYDNTGSNEQTAPADGNDRPFREDPLFTLPGSAKPAVRSSADADNNADRLDAKKKPGKTAEHDDIMDIIGLTGKKEPSGSAESAKFVESSKPAQSARPARSAQSADERNDLIGIEIAQQGEAKPESETKISLDELSPSMIDDLIRLLEKEKKNMNDD